MYGQLASSCAILSQHSLQSKKKKKNQEENNGVITEERERAAQRVEVPLAAHH